MATVRVPGGLGDITPGWLTTALERGGVSRGATVIGYSAQAIAEGTGFMNQVFRLRVDYDVDNPGLPGSIIVKLPSSDPWLRRVSDSLGQHRREVRFYQDLATDPRLAAPVCYYSDVDPVTGDTVLVLEDLSHARQGDSVIGCGFGDARRAIDQLARFQANWWDSSALEALEWMPSREAEAVLYQEIYPGAWWSLLERTGDGMPHGLRQLGKQMKPEVPRIKSKLATSPRTIVHGDYRLDNCFFPADGGPHPLVALDWEFCVRGRGIYDVATFIAEAFPVQQRREVEPALVRRYHSALMAEGVANYSFAECWHDYRLAMLEIFVFWIVTGGYCNYEGDRATLYLLNTLERLDAAISDLASVELLSH